MFYIERKIRRKTKSTGCSQTLLALESKKSTPKKALCLEIVELSSLFPRTVTGFDEEKQEQHKRLLP